MPLDLRKASFKPHKQTGAGTLPVAPTTETAADALEDPLLSHGMGLTDRLSEAGSQLMGSKSAGSKRKAKVEGLMESINKMGSSVRCEYLRKHFREPLAAHMTETFNMENLLFLEALDDGMAKAEVLSTFIHRGAEHEINVGARGRDAAKAGSFEGARMETQKMIGGDVWHRLRFDAKFLDAVSKKL